jgi:hypothetical protein
VTARLVAVAIAALTVPAAADSWTWDDEASELEVRNFYKSMATLLRVPDELVEAADVPRHGALWTHITRTWGRLVLRDRLVVQAGWQVGAVISSDPVFSSGAVFGGVLSEAARAQRRLVDLDPLLVERGGFSLVHDLDLLAIELDTSRADFTVGRQVLSWGSGRLWNPTDLLSPFAPTDIDREVRRGVDAVRASISLAATSQLELLWLPLPDLRDHGAVGRVQINVEGFDIAPSAAKYVRDTVVGLDVTGDIGKYGVHAEVAWTRALDRDELGNRDQFVRAVIGGDARLSDETIFTAEYYYNGWGATDASSYLAVLTSDRVRRGEAFGAGRHYLGASAAWRKSELLALNGVALVNLADPSVVVVPSLEYWAEQQVLVRAGGYLPIGRRPSGDPSTSLALRSEYGASPFGLFAQLAIYLL